MSNDPNTPTFGQFAWWLLVTAVGGIAMITAWLIIDTRSEVARARSEVARIDREIYGMQRDNKAFADDLSQVRADVKEILGLIRGQGQN